MAEFVTSDGVKLHFSKEGTGLPVICLAGLTRNSTDFDYMLPHIPPCQTIRLDYRGRGQSDWADYKTYTIPREAQDTLELMNHLGLERAAIIGTSRGGLIAMSLAVMARDRLIGVCLNDIGPELDEEGLAVIRGYIGRDPAVKTLKEVAELRAVLMEGFSDVPTSRWMEEASKHYIVTEAGLKINYDPKLRDAMEHAGTETKPDLWPLFDALDGLPLGIIRGENSDLLTRGTAREMHRRRPDAFFTEVAGRGHVPFLDEPQAVEVLQKFIRACQ